MDNTELTDRLLGSYESVGGINHLDGKNLCCPNTLRRAFRSLTLVIVGRPVLRRELSYLRVANCRNQARMVEMSRPDLVIAGMISIGVIGKLMDVGLRRMERALVPWRAQYQGG